MPSDKKIRKWQTHPLYQQRPDAGFYAKTVSDLRKHAEKFHNYTRMSIRQFDHLLEKIKYRLEKCEQFREPIPPDFRLMVALRHLATGDSFKTLSYEYLLGVATIPHIIYEVYDVIWNELQKLYVSWPSDLTSISEGFLKKYKFPHCCGALDGKHIRIPKPPDSGSLYYNYKGFHSINLMAVCDADCNIMYANIGSYGCQSDQCIFQYSSLGKAISIGNVNWPSKKYLPRSNIPFGHFLIGDEAYPISENVMRPYSGRNLAPDKVKFNKLFATARCTIERTYGILTGRFNVMKYEMNAVPKNAEKIVKACVVLHNYVRKTRDEDTPKDPPIEKLKYKEKEKEERSIGRPSVIGSQNRDIYKKYILGRKLNKKM